jgi:hypothetical protein
MHVLCSASSHDSILPPSGPQLPDGWERRVMAAVKTLTARKMLVHIPGHTGKLRLSKAALAAAEHHTHVHKAHKVRAMHILPRERPLPPLPGLRAQESCTLHNITP